MPSTRSVSSVNTDWQAAFGVSPPIMPAPLLPAELSRLLAETPELKKAYLVGGGVRDWLLNQSNKDFDLEVFGLSYEKLTQALSRWGRVDLVGRSFGVVKLTMSTGVCFDFTVPRLDSKVGVGHKGFEIEFAPDLSLREAAARRDFTINALMFDTRRGELLDFFGGQEDLRKRVLRHTSEAFVEDPLRVLRGMQFAGRFHLTAAPETIELCRQIKSGFSELAVERIRDEWLKWAEKSAVPSAGLRFLADTEWLEHFPEVHALVGTLQDPGWHPEGDVFTHTNHCLDALVSLPAWRAADAESKWVYSFAVLAHDFGKPATTRPESREGVMRIVSPGHEEAGGRLAESFLNRIGVQLSVRERVVPLVENHLAHLQATTDRAVRRLARRLHPENIFGLAVVVTADQFGRPPRPRVISESLRDLLARAETLQVQNRAPHPILLGRHLVAAGLVPGPVFGSILEAAYDAQLEGQFADLYQAKLWLAGRDEFDLPEDVRAKLNSSHS